MYVILCYDIQKDRRRTKLFKRLGAVLTHVQFSVFEGEVPDGGREELVALATRGIDPETDRVRIYTLCRTCRAAMRHVGQSAPLPDPKAPIIV